jgi:hypothetical protein
MLRPSIPPAGKWFGAPLKSGCARICARNRFVLKVLSGFPFLDNADIDVQLHGKDVLTMWVGKPFMGWGSGRVCGAHVIRWQTADISPAGARPE